MVDLRPAGYVIGLLLMVLGLTMVIPMGLDWLDSSSNWLAFALSSFTTTIMGAVIALASQNTSKVNLNIQQTFFLTTNVWLILPIFGALPFIFGATEARFIDAFLKRCLDLQPLDLLYLVHWKNYLEVCFCGEV